LRGGTNATQTDPARDDDPRPAAVATAQKEGDEMRSRLAKLGIIRPQNGGIAATSRPTSRGRKASTDAAPGDIAAQSAQNAHKERAPKTKSYPLRRGNGRDHAQGSV
jgi:hypothetical protein